jgi:hypothetical protein
MAKEIKLPCKVVCIDDAKKPVEIPDYLWVKDKRVYTATKLHRTQYGKNTWGFTLAELTLTDAHFPYSFYSCHRFAIIDPNNEEEIIAYLEAEILEEV